MTNIKIGIIGGSGLDNPNLFIRREEKVVNTPFGKPSDALIIGEINNVPCVLLSRHGRAHDIMPGNVNYRANVWALKEEGCTHIIASTATGSLREHISRGDIVIVDSFIDRTQGRKQTFHDGEEGHPPGVCHVPMEPAFCPRLRGEVIKAASELGIKVHEKGTVVAIEGPRFSSRAESHMFRLWGGDIINMTSCPEICLAKEAGICYVQIAVATDYDCWREDLNENVCVAEVLKTFKENVSKVTDIIKYVIPKIAAGDWEQTLNSLKSTIENSIQGPA